MAQHASPKTTTSEASLAELQVENQNLRQLVVELTKIVVRQTLPDGVEADDGKECRIERC